MASNQDKKKQGFQPPWSEEQHIKDDVFLPLDLEKRTAHVKVPPQDILDIAHAVYKPNENTPVPLKSFHLFLQLPPEMFQNL
jgi:hypothetical protein